MQRCIPEGSSAEDRTSGSDEGQHDWDKELIRAVGMKIGKAEKDPEKVRLDRINVCLDEGANINVQDHRNGDTVLHVAVRKDYQKIVKSVLQRGARTDIPNYEGDTAVRLAEILDKKQIECILKGPDEQRSGLQVCRLSAAGGFVSVADYQRPSTSRGTDMVAVSRSEAHFHFSEREENINESPGFVMSEIYSAGDELTRAWSGIVYQWQYLEFTLHCAFQAGYKFFAATEMTGVGKLDDVDLFYENHEGKIVARFVQLKYSIDRSNISPSELLSENGNYSVSAHFMSSLEIEDQERFSGIRVRHMILCTTKGLDVEYLKKHGIWCDVVEDPDETFELKSKIKGTPTCYRFSANEVTNKKLYDELRGSVPLKLARLLVNYIHNSEKKTVKIDGFQSYHRALAKDVFIKNIDTKSYEFRQNFIENKNLSQRVERFRQKFLFAYREMFKSPETRDDKSVWEDIKKRFGKLACRQEFRESLEAVNPRAKCELPDIDTKISEFFEDFTLVTHLPDKTELDAIINRKIRDHNDYCSEQRAKQIGGAFHREIQKWFSVRDNKGNKVPFLTREVCKQLLDDVKHKVDSPNELIRKPVVKFQGHETCFGKLLDIRDSYHLRADELEDFVKMVDSRTVFKIILGEEIRIGEGLQGLREIGNYYMNRTIYQHVIIEEAIFYDEQLPDFLAISGINREPTNNFTPTGDTSPAMERNLTNITILKNGQEEEQFRALCVENPRRNIHWLEKQARRWIWKRSQGDITYLIEYRDPWGGWIGRRDAIHLSESDLAADCKPMIISDEMGKGKSTLLIYLAEKIKEDEPDLLVLQIDLTKHTAALDEISRKKSGHDLGTINGAVQFLVNELLSHRENLTREVFKRIILQQRKVALIVDGFDHISPKYDGIVIDLLQALSNHGIKKLFVTTVPDFRGVLERKLKAFAYTIEPLSVFDVEDFLIKYCTSKPGVHCDTAQEIEDRARNSAEVILTMIRAGDLSHILDSPLMEFNATPLQTKLVADYFEKDLKRELMDAKSDQQKSPTMMCSDRSLRVFSAVHHELLRLEKRGRKYFKSYDSSNTISRIPRRSALWALFGLDKVREWLPLPKDKAEMLDIAPDGFAADYIGYEPSRMERLYAEKWAIGFFTEMLIQGNSKERARKFFVADILLQHKYRNLRCSLNHNLRGKNVGALVADESWKFHLNEHRGMLNETVFHVAAKENNIAIIEILLNCLRTNRQDQTTLVNTKDFIGKTAVHWAVEYAGSLEPINVIVEHTDFEIDSRDREGVTPLFRAASLGELNIVKYLLDNKANINSETDGGMTPLDGAFITGQWDVVEYLRTRGASSNKFK